MVAPIFKNLSLSTVVVLTFLVAFLMIVPLRMTHAQQMTNLSGDTAGVMGSNQMQELQLQIQYLMQLVMVLQARLAAQQNISATSPITPNSVFSDGDTVKTTSILNIRSAPSMSSSLIGRIPLGIKGEIIDGPRSASGYTWWYVSYENGVKGWSAGNWLTLVSRSQPTVESQPQEVESTKSESANAITVVRPNGGEKLKRGSTYTVRWKASKTNMPYVDIYTLSSDGTTKGSIASNVPNTGSYTWNIASTHIEGAQRLYVTHGTYSDHSDRVFEIWDASHPTWGAEPVENNIEKENVKIRDASRREDMNLIARALQAYATDHGSFRVEGAGFIPQNGIPNGNGLFNHECPDNLASCSVKKSVARALNEGGYLGNGILDPLNVTAYSSTYKHQGYKIIVTQTKAGTQHFTVWADLEAPTTADKATLNKCHFSEYDNGMDYCVSGSYEPQNNTNRLVVRALNHTQILDTNNDADTTDDEGVFILNVNMYATDGPAYVKSVGVRDMEAPGALFHIEDAQGGVYNKGAIVVTLSSDDASKEGQYLVIPDNSAVTLTLRVYFNPEDSNFYSVVWDGFVYSDAPTANAKQSVYKVPSSEAEDYETDLLSI